MDFGLESLKGNLSGFHSIRVNDQWRIVFRWDAGAIFSLYIPAKDVKVKQKIINEQVIQSMPEYDDCVRLTNENKVSLAEINAEINNNLE